MVMKVCCDCEKEVTEGYYRDPVTGKQSKSFWCDDCFEHGMQRHPAKAIYNSEVAMNYAYKASNRRETQQRAEY